MSGLSSFVSTTLSLDVCKKEESESHVGDGEEQQSSKVDVVGREGTQLRTLLAGRIEAFL